MNVFCSWCNDPIRWSGIEYGVSHSICRRCCREHFPSAAVQLAILAMPARRSGKTLADLWVFNEQVLITADKAMENKKEK